MGRTPQAEQEVRRASGPTRLEPGERLVASGPCYRRVERPRRPHDPMGTAG